MQFHKNETFKVHYRLSCFMKFYDQTFISSILSRFFFRLERPEALLKVLCNPLAIFTFSDWLGRGRWERGWSECVT
jgi:hypothetical protein